MNRCEIERLEHMIVTIRKNKIKIKYLNKYLEEVSSKINNTFEEYKSFKVSCKYTENDINKLFTYEEELMKLTYEKNMLISEISRLDILITAFNEEIEQIKSRNSEIDIKKDSKVIDLDEFIKNNK